MTSTTQEEDTVMKQLHIVQLMMVFGAAITLAGCGSDDAIGQQSPPQPFVAPTVFQAAGPNIASIQNTVDPYRDALWATDNRHTTGPLADWRRESNWGGAATNTVPAPTPSELFRNNRRARFTTPGTGFVQVTTQGMADHFANQSSSAIFQPFSNQGMLSSDGSTVTNVEFFVPVEANVSPGTLADKPATTKGFRAVLTHVAQPNGSGQNHINADRSPSRFMEYFDADGELLFKGVVSASPSEKSLSSSGIVFTDARIVKVKIVSGGYGLGERSRTER